MGVFLGSAGSFELRRTSIGEAYASEIQSSDVNATTNRFSFDFPTGQFLTGDLLAITATDGSLLDFIDPAGWAVGGPYENGNWYIHVDQVGGITLHRTFDEAISGEAATRINLLSLNRTIPITATVENIDKRCLAQVTKFEINTERQAVDVTELGDSFRQQFSGLITGSGTLTCFFDYEHRQCDDGVSPDSELPIYLNQLILRSQIGSEFFARLTLVGRGLKPGGTIADINDSVWYDIQGLITNVAMAFEPTQPIQCVVSYVTTGEIKLRTQSDSGYLTLQQSAGGRIELEELENGFIELESFS